MGLWDGVLIENIRKKKELSKKMLVQFQDSIFFVSLDEFLQILCIKAV